MKKQSFILVAGAAVIALAMIFGGCAAATDSSGPTTEALNDDTIILDKNAVFTIEGVIQAFAEGYNPVYFVGSKDLDDTDVEFLNARSFVPAGKTLVVTTYASRATGTLEGSLSMGAEGKTLKIAGNLTVKSEIAALKAAFTLGKGANLTIGGNFEVGKLGMATVSGTVTQTSGTAIKVAGGTFTLSEGASWTVQRKTETEAAPGIDIAIGKDSVVMLLAPVVIGSGDFTVAARSGGVINDAPTVYIASVVTGDENSTATLGTSPIYGIGGLLRIANKINADGTAQEDTKTGNSIPKNDSEWAGINTYEVTLDSSTGIETISVPVGKTLVIAASVDCGGAALKIESAGTVLIPTGVTVAGATITLGGETSGDVTPPQPNLVISGAFGGVITGGANDYNEDERWSRLIVPGQGINMTLGNNDSITLDAEGWISWKSKYSLTKDIEVPATAKYDFTGFSTTLSEMSLVANGVTLTIQKGAKIKGAKMWFTGIPDSVSDELENGAKYTYTIKLTHDGRVAFQVPKTVDVIDENGNEYITS